MNEVIITGCVGLFTTVASGLATFLFTKKKYNSEVDSTVIENMQKALDFYKTLCQDTNARLDELLLKNIELEKEVKELRSQVSKLAPAPVKTTRKKKADEN